MIYVFGKLGDGLVQDFNMIEVFNWTPVKGSVSILQYKLVPSF